MNIGLYSAVINAKTTSDAWRDWSKKEIRVKKKSNPLMSNEILDLYRRYYIHRMAVRFGSSNKMNEYKKDEKFGNFKN